MHNARHYFVQHFTPPLTAYFKQMNSETMHWRQSHQRLNATAIVDLVLTTIKKRTWSTQGASCTYRILEITPDH
jgi:hypothetical protein